MLVALGELDQAPPQLCLALEQRHQFLRLRTGRIARTEIRGNQAAHTGLDAGVCDAHLEVFHTSVDRQDYCVHALQSVLDGEYFHAVRYLGEPDTGRVRIRGARRDVFEDLYAEARREDGVGEGGTELAVRSNESYFFD